MRAKLDKKSKVKIFTFKGDLKQEIDKCKKELAGKQKYRDYHEWKFDCAKKEYDAFMKRYNELKDFLELAEEELKKREDSKSE